MSKPTNAVESETIRVTLSHQSLALLEKLAALGIYGRNPAEVAGRFIDAALDRFVAAPRFKLDVDGDVKEAKEAAPSE